MMLPVQGPDFETLSGVLADIMLWRLYSNVESILIQGKMSNETALTRSLTMLRYKTRGKYTKIIVGAKLLFGGLFPIFCNV